jgi:hypothetical protein
MNVVEVSKAIMDNRRKKKYKDQPSSKCGVVSSTQRCLEGGEEEAKSSPVPD